jgi:hypothetical protein
VEYKETSVLIKLKKERKKERKRHMYEARNNGCPTQEGLAVSGYLIIT